MLTIHPLTHLTPLILFQEYNSLGAEVLALESQSAESSALYQEVQLSFDMIAEEVSGVDLVLHCIESW